MAQLRQKTWAVLTKPYFFYNGSAVTIEDIEAMHPCQPNNRTSPLYVSPEDDNPWTTYFVSTSFAEIRNAVRRLMIEVGLKKEEIQVVELVPHDYVVTPLT